MHTIEIQGFGMKKNMIALFWLTLAVTGAAQADTTADFEALLDEHWEWTLSNSPEMASGLGDRRFNRDWQDKSINAIERRHMETREFLQRTYAIDRKALQADQQLNYELFRRQLQDAVDNHQFKGYLLLGPKC